jgi:hypothetical protein
VRTGILTISCGAVLLIAGVAGLVIVPEHAPSVISADSIVIPGTTKRLAGFGRTVVGGWSRSVYDLARIATWALLIIGAILVVMGLIRYARRSAAAA